MQTCLHAVPTGTPLSRWNVIAAITIIAALSVGNASAADWLTMPGQFSHDPASGQRIGQYAAKRPATTAAPPPVRTSGFTHTRSSLHYGQSADNYFRVERYGDGPAVRPFGEWRFPYRPFSVPYDAWGPPYGGLNLNFPVVPGAAGLATSRFGRAGLGGAGLGGGLYDPRVRTQVPPAARLPWPYPAPTPSGAGTLPGSPSTGFSDASALPRGGRGGRTLDPSFPSDRRTLQGLSAPPAGPLTPYPAGGGTPYPVAPYYDGYYPVYRQ